MFLTEKNFLKKIIKCYKTENPLIEVIRNSKKPVLIYGAGVYAFVLNSYLNALKINVQNFLVDELPPSQKSFSNVSIAKLEEFLPTIGDYILLIGIANYPTILPKLAKKGISNYFILDVPDFLNIPKPFLDYNFVEEKAPLFTEAYNLYEDDISKHTFIAAINTKITHEIKYLKPYVKYDNLYFPSSEFQISSKETLIDAGGYNGDTIFDFIKISNGRFNKIISLEPNYKMFLELKESIKNIELKKHIFPLMLGAWDTKTQLNFENTELNIDSKVSESGKNSIQVDRIDNIINSFDEKLSLIKMDINGSEFNALKGCEKTIENHKPNIAVKMHMKKDFYRIPMLLKKINPRIKLYLRQRNHFSLTLMLYARFS